MKCNVRRARENEWTDVRYISGRSTKMEAVNNKGIEREEAREKERGRLIYPVK